MSDLEHNVNYQACTLDLMYPRIAGIQQASAVYIKRQDEIESFSQIY